MHHSPPESAHIQDFFEGDIRLTPKQIEMMKIGTSEEKGLHHINERAVVRNIADTWPGAVVPYVFSSSLGKYGGRRKQLYNGKVYRA